MAKILFVEDHVEMIEELVELMSLEYPDGDLFYAANIPEAIKILQSPFDGVVLDVMLPSFSGIRDDSEGLLLAAWLLGKKHGFDKLQSPVVRPAWAVHTPPKVVLLTARTPAPLELEWKELGGSDGEILIIERLLKDAFVHCKLVRDWIEGGYATKEN